MLKMNGIHVTIILVIYMAICWALGAFKENNIDMNDEERELYSIEQDRKKWDLIA